MTITVTRAMTDRERAVWDVLKRHAGRANAVGRAELVERSGVPDRKLRDVIHALVVDHRKRIVSDYSGRGGYFVPADEREVEEHVRILKAHALSILHRMAVLKRTSVADVQRELFQGDLFDV